MRRCGRLGADPYFQMFSVSYKDTVGAAHFVEVVRILH
jgi:hypothetical protein